MQQLGDAAVSLIILIAFSLVSAGASNYIVTERVSGEKLQQRLSDVSFKTYWGVNFMWDFTVSVNILRRMSNAKCIIVESVLVVLNIVLH